MNAHQARQAGAPTPPAGLFWRVDDTAYGMYRVQLRRLGEYGGSEVVSQAASWPHETIADLAEVCRRALSRLPRPGS